jgi:hypothetical protein
VDDYFPYIVDSNNWSCLTAGTKITTRGGNNLFEDLKEDDILIS